MTRRSLELIAAADVILYDRLDPAGGARRRARRTPSCATSASSRARRPIEQEEINALLVELGRAGRGVVRLKGGDPFVFGRGGEEAEALAAAGVAFEVVPGVTAGVAAPAYAGIPVTHRDAASAVAFVTGHEDPGEGGVGARLGGARPLPRHARVLHGRAQPPADRRAAARRRARPAAAGGGGGARHPVRPAHRHRAARRDRRARGRGGPAAAGDHRHRPRRRACATRSPGSSAVRCTARSWRSRAPAPRPAGSPPGCASSAPRCSRRPRSGSSRAPFSSPAPETYDLICFTSPNGVRLLLRRARPRRPGARRRHRGGHRARHRRRARAARHRGGRRARALRGRGPARGAARRERQERAGRAGGRGPRRAAGRAARARRVGATWLPLYDTVAEPLSAEQRGLGARDLRDLHLQLHRPLLPRRRAASCPTARAWCRSAR